MLDFKKELAGTLRFIVDGDRSSAYSLQDMLKANADSPDVCDWLQAAKPGDVFNDLCRVECIAGLPAEWAAS